ncbi:DUF5304 domain-containing protein [Streptomyces sp. P9(2023)]|uniref:DUF5304 domain-containing protein n=1 Tax=Streptomyces sp. P9(2023) TaxID=3064394 RepID=UPI0028F4562E|nr:DUF5304 domain-containing protein [Streptomyces sp. P9(2023)]MDT9687976.1 DUF5304 domain-containing protein [Streptomyces sp. P9(2023)]
MSDSDAWAKACAEDLEAEKARRRAASGAEPGSAAEEFRKLFDAVAEKVSGLRGPLAGMAAQGTVQQFVNQAKAAVEPIVERNPQVFDHLAAAGNELLAAYRSAVESHETRWTRDEPNDPRRDGPAQDAKDPEAKPRPDDDGPGPGRPIDLD